MENKFTPGPWFLDTLGDGSMLIQPREGFSICPVTPRDGFESDRANFQLMAAAPDLLHALRLMLDRFGGSDEDDLDQYAIEAARAAIRKAENNL